MRWLEVPRHSPALEDMQPPTWRGQWQVKRTLPRTKPSCTSVCGAALPLPSPKDFVPGQQEAGSLEIPQTWDAGQKLNERNPRLGQRALCQVGTWQASSVCICVAHGHACACV